MGNTKNTGYLQNIVQYDASNNITLPANLTVTSNVAINNTTPHDTTQFSLDINGGLIVKNTGKTAQFVIINSNPATGGNHAFVQHTVGGTSGSSYADIQGYYGLAVTGSTVIRLNPLGGNVLVGSLAGTGTRVVVASSTGVLSTQAAQTIGDLNGVPTSRTITINGTTQDLSADRTFTINSMVYPGAGIAVSTGTAWGTSLTDNSSNWNTAYGWGNHAGLYSLLNHTHTFASLTSKPTTLVGYGITDAATSAQGTSADTAYGWGNHASGGYVTLTGTQTISGVKTFSTYQLMDVAILIKHGSNTSTGGYTGIGSVASGLTINLGIGTTGSLLFNTSASYSYTFPAASGTIALTSDLSTYATQTYVGTQIANLVASSPAALDTLNELAAALGNDAAFSTTVSTALGNRLRVDINNQGLSATLQGYGRTNLGLGTAATSATGDFVAYRTFGTAANSAIGDFVAYRTFGTAANNNTGDFAAASHTHSIANVTGLQTALDGKQASGSYAAATHSHIISDVTGLQTALDGKQASLGFTPYNSTNPSGYITGINSSAVTTALGFTPWNYASIDAGRNIVSGTNLDTDLESGGAYGSYGAGGTSWNAPFSYGAVLAFAFTSGIKAQFGFDIRHGSSDYGDLLYRTKNNVGYSTWRTMWHSGNLTNNNQLTNGAGYITSSGSISGNAATATSAAVLTSSGSLTTQFGNGTVGYVYGIASATTGLFYTTNNSNSIITINRHPDNYYSQLGFNSIGGIFYRSFSATAINTSQGWQTIWTSNSLINLDQLSNGPGYITGYTETDTLASVTGRGASTSTALSINNTLTVTNGRLTVRTGGANTYGIVSGYDNNNHMMTFRADVTGPTASPTYTAGHQMTFIEYAQAGDTTGWFFKSSSSTNYEEIARITRAGATFSGTISASNYSGTHSGSSSGTNTGDQTNISGNAATATSATSASSAGTVTGRQRGSFTVGGNTDTFYPVAFQIGSASTGEQGISLLQIERGGYDNPGYSNYTFSTFHCRIRAKADGWGFGASYVQVEANAYTTPMLAEVSQQNQTSQLIVWLRGACAYRWIDIEGGWTLNFSNPNGGNYVTFNGNTTYSPTTTNTIGGNFKYQQGWGNNYISGTFTAGGDVVAFSDARVKENIRPIDNVLDRICNSRGVLYDRTDNESKDNIGFIAQELEENFPELVTTDGDRKSVKYQNAAAVLFEAVKELKAENDTQKSEIDELKDLVQQLINR